MGRKSILRAACVAWPLTGDLRTVTGAAGHEGEGEGAQSERDKKQ
jgi:hypothetical protein